VIRQAIKLSSTFDSVNVSAQKDTAMHGLLEDEGLRIQRFRGCRDLL
jgi:hypothetical protein